MKPSVGRIVHFYTKDLDKQFNGSGEGPYPAIITQVGFGATGYESMVNLKVLHYGGMYDAGSVSNKEQAAKHGDTLRYWEWPPREEDNSAVKQAFRGSGDQIGVG